MSRCMKWVVIGISVLLPVLFVSSVGFAAKASFDSPPGAPPYGLAVHGNAGGTKLYGVVEVEYYDVVRYQSTISFQARAVARLQQGNKLQTFYAAPNIVFTDDKDPAVVQGPLMNAFAPQVLDFFFPGQFGLCIWLKNVTEYSELDVPATGYQNKYIVMDVELAVNSSTCP